MRALGAETAYADGAAAPTAAEGEEVPLPAHAPSTPAAQVAGIAAESRGQRPIAWAAIGATVLLMAAVPSMEHHTQNASLWLVTWLGLGGIAGLVARWLGKGAGDGGALDTVLAIVGAMAGGLALAAIGPAPARIIDAYGSFIAAITAIAVLLLHDAAAHRRTG